MVGGSAPLRLVHGRPVVTLDGGVHALLDTGARAILLSAACADALGLTVIETVEEGGEVFTVLEPPSLSAGGYELDTDGLPAYGFEDTRVIGLATSGLDLLLPASLLLRHAVVLDPVDGTATFGPPGSLERFGVRVPARVSGADAGAAAGHCSVTVEVLGVPSTLLLDTGVSCSLASSSTVSAWLSASPSLPRSAAAVGPGNMAGLRVEARTPMVRAPAVEVGEFTVPAVAFVVRGDADVAPFDGSLGGNVLRSFRIGLDLARGDLFLEQRVAVEGGGADTDQVGVTLVLSDPVEVSGDGDGGVGGEWTIGAAVTGLSPTVEVGDVVLAVDGTPVTGMPLPDVLARLAGEPGETTHHLTLRRGTDELTAAAPVIRVL